MDDDQILINDPALDEDKREEDRMLWERGIDPKELSTQERTDLVDDLRGDTSIDDDDDDKLSDVTQPEEADGAD